MEKNLKYINLEYTNADLQYIDDLCSYLDKKCEEIVKFFQLKEFGEKTNVKLWDDINKFRELHKSFFHKVDSNGQVAKWICGFALKNSIHTLSLDEYRKTQGREKAELINLKNLIIHEFVHIVHGKLHNNKIMFWLTEGLATFLSSQYENCDLNFEASLDEIKKGGATYINYYTMFSYVFNKYGKEYIIKLILDEVFLQNETDRLYQEVAQMYRE